MPHDATRRRPPPRAPLAERGWQAEAECRTLPPELFFPAGRTGPAMQLAEAAKAVCARCPVADACLRYALETNQEYGVWGGTSEDERREMRASVRRGSPTVADPAELGRGAAN